jgi:hypothetical protein
MESRFGGSAWNGRTEIDLPACIDPSSESRAACASSDVESVTNPKPRGLPVARSFGRLISETVPPVASNNCLNTSSVMLSGKPATNSLRASSFAMKKLRILP